MGGTFNYTINLEFVSEDKSKLLENIYKELDEPPYVMYGGFLFY
jgi:hypothetical protein